MFPGTEIAVLDLEYTSWQGCVETGWDTDAGQYREAVQVAAVLTDVRSFGVIETFDRFVRPRINPELSEYFRELTGICQADVAEAPPFEDVAGALLGWVGDRHVYSWGNDLDVLDRNVELYGADVEFDGAQFHDVRPVLRAQGVPVDAYRSGTVAEFFGAEPAGGGDHDALYDCLSILEALRAAGVE